MASDDARLAEQLAESLRHTQVQSEKLLGEIESRARVNAEIRAAIEELRRNMNALSLEVEGNGGKKGLELRIELIENELNYVKRWIEQEKLRQAEETRAKLQEEKESHRVQWDRILAIGLGVLGFVGSLAALFWK